MPTRARGSKAGVAGPLPRVVVVDANILYSAGLRNLFVWLRVKEVIHLHWTREIDDEWIRNLAKDRGTAANAFLHGVAALMKDAAPDWEVEGFESYIGRFEGVDEEDQHVAAAAYKLSLEVWPGQPVALVTQNVLDFKQSAFAGSAVIRYSPAGFLSRLMRESPAEVAAACEAARLMFRKPRETQANYVQRLREAHGCGEFADQLAQRWRLPASPPSKPVGKRR
jgi:hypothetical protein